jgi:hypothetical protein
MFNNVALDVFIGLVFIFLLYSLLASAINEFIAMLFAYRHRMLEKAIEQMLDGKNYSYYWWDKLINIFLWLIHKIRFSSGVTASLKEQDTGNKINRKDFFKTCNINPQTTDKASPKIYRSKLNKKAALFAANITNHPLYRRKSEDSLLYKKPAYLTASAFSDILMDVLSNKKSIASTAPVLMNDIKTFVNNELDHNPDLKNILNLYIQQANGDIQKFKLLIENWFDDTMNRVSGWYKRQATKILFVIGLVLAMGLNISTIDIVHRLSVDKDLREAMAQSATNYVKTKNAQISSFTDKDSLDTAVNKQIATIHTLYDSTIAPVNSLMGLGWDYSKMNTTIKHGYLNLPYYLIPSRWKKYYFKVRFILHQTAKRPRSLFGFLITALAITMGAPFWFDLLNRFVNLRGGGNKPSEDSPNRSTPVSITERINQKPAINSFG